jgi:hypothetical protein
MPAEVVRPPTAGHRSAAARTASAGRPPERAQLVWRRALELASPPSQHDRFGVALGLLRTAHHTPATMAHALNLGRTHLRAHPDDAPARGGVAILEEAIAFLGIKPRADDVAGAGR